MKQDTISARFQTLQRAAAWVVGGLVSLGLAVTLSLIALTAAVRTPYRDQGLLGAGIGMFTVAVVWPGLLTACVIFFDGFVTDGLSKRILGRAFVWGLLPPTLFFVLLKFGISWVGIAGTVGGRGIGTLVALVIFVAPSLISAYLAIRLQLPFRGFAK